MVSDKKPNGNPGKYYRTMLLGISIILLSIAIIIKSQYVGLPLWLLRFGRALPYIGFVVCIWGFIITFADE